MFKGFVIIAVASLAHLVVSSQKEDAIKIEENVKVKDEIVNTYQSLFNDQERGCSCKDNFCQCCEDQFANVCLIVAYYEVSDLPVAFGINITSYKKHFLSVTVNVTNLPCIKLPYVKIDFAVCLQLYDFHQSAEHIQVRFKLKVKLLKVSEVDTYLGCLMIPRLHPEVTSTTVQSDSLLKRVGENKASKDSTGWAFCSSPNSALSNAPQNFLLLLPAISVAVSSFFCIYSN